MTKTKGVVDKAWESIIEGYNICKKKYPNIKFDTNGYDRFKEIFEKRYDDIINRFMRPDTSALDSHKQAALITICFLESNTISHSSHSIDEISIIPQSIAVNAALSYMKDCINISLKENGIRERIGKYYLPIALTCDTPYQEIICRLLYYEETEDDMNFNVLELADRYFLLEYINLLNYGIEPVSLKQDL